MRNRLIVSIVSPRPLGSVLVRSVLVRVALVWGALALAPLGAARAELGDLLRTLSDPQPFGNGGFGFALAARGDELLVGAVGQPVAGKQKAGLVYRLDPQTGEVRSTIPNPQPAANDFFGRWIDASDNRILISTYLDDDAGAVDAGAAYLYDAQTAELLHTFYDPHPGADERFGSRSTLIGDDVLVGAYKDNSGGPLHGAAFLFSGETGQLLHTLYDPSPADGDRFGYYVDNYQDQLLVSAYRDSALAGNTGAVFLFDRESGALTRTINNPIPQAGALFGYGVDTSGPLIAIGARDAAFGSGGAFVIDGQTGKQVFRQVDYYGERDDEFGASLLIVGDTILVGAPGADDGAGQALLYDGPTGQLLYRFTDPSPQPGERFGSRLAAIGNELYISAPDDRNENGTAVGRVFVFEAAPPRTPGDADRDGTVGAADYAIWAAQFGKTRLWQSGDFNGDGVVGTADYAIWAANVPGSQGVQQVPEPGGVILIALGFALMLTRGRLSAHR